MASFRSHSGSKQSIESRKDIRAPVQSMAKYGGETKLLPQDENNCNSPDFAKIFGETQLEVFHHQHGLLVLHLLAMIMFVPSMMAWVQVGLLSMGMINTTRFQRHQLFEAVI